MTRRIRVSRQGMCLVTLLPQNIRNAHGELPRGVSPDASDLGSEME
jgi:hypothetical protein